MMNEMECVLINGKCTLLTQKHCVSMTDKCVLITEECVLVNEKLYVVITEKKCVLIPHCSPYPRFRQESNFGPLNCESSSLLTAPPWRIIHRHTCIRVVRMPNIPIILRYSITVIECVLMNVIECVDDCD